MKPKKPIIPTLEQAKTDLLPTIGKLLAAYKSATIEASEEMDRKGLEDGPFFSHHVRYLAKVRLHREGLEAKDEDCELEPTANTGICLTMPNYLIRVLRDAKNGVLPSAGDSDRRKRFFAQKAEQLPLFEAMDADGEREPVHIAILWNCTMERRFTGLWLICPNGDSEKNAHFSEFFPVPEMPGETGLFDSVEPDMPPDNLGLTRRRKQEQPRKTGTESNEQ